ncbi:MAG: hypothetical protein HY925_00870 [Elusimicrobia bacterium]|nr:hypothetical protein [Elusimicrobiota bacterium]
MTSPLSLLAALALSAFAEGPMAADKPPVQDKPPAAAPAGAVSVSTNIAIGSTIEEIYTGAALRDPFIAVAGAAKASAIAALAPGETPIPAGTVPSEDFSIHSLELKGVMEDKTGGFAILVDPKFGASFVLRRGKLFDVRNKLVPGVTGMVKAKQKSVMLIGPGPEHDKRVLTMAEKDEEENNNEGASADASKAKTQ